MSRIDYAGFRFPKGTPRAVTKIVTAKAASAAERACRAKVDARDGRRCFYPNCKHAATEKHHIIPSSVRGKREWQTKDILSACHLHHAWFKAGLIRVSGNPDRGSVKVIATELGKGAGVRVPARKGSR